MCNICKIGIAQIMGVSAMLLTLLTACEQIPSEFASPQSSQSSSSQPFASIVNANLPAPTKTLICDDFKTNQTVTITGRTQLANGCDLTGKGVRFVLNQSDASLDCNGATLSPQNETDKASAITIRPKNDATAIRNISVANCHITGYGHALHIRKATNPNQRYAKRDTNPQAIDPDANRATAPQYIRIVNVSSMNSINSGIFVGDHVHHVTFDRLYVARSGTVGLYFEFGSRHNTVKNSVFVDNGFRTFKPNREAIAIDSSAFNVIQNNEFVHNGAGGVHLYRNCFEHADDPSRSNHFKRTESASNNVIEGNLFRDEPVGVWVASRQSRNLRGFECGAYVLGDTAFARYHLDSAKNNQIMGNEFVNVDTGIIVEDDGTQIIGNDFRQVAGVPYKNGSEIREKYGKPVVGTVIQGNEMD